MRAGDGLPAPTAETMGLSRAPCPRAGTSHPWGDPTRYDWPLVAPPSVSRRFSVTHQWVIGGGGGGALRTVGDPPFYFL